MNVLLWQVSKAVPEMAVSGAAGGVKFAVYTAVPFTTLTFDKTPLTKPAVEPYPPPTLMVLDVLIKFVLLDKVKKSMIKRQGVSSSFLLVFGTIFCFVDE